jgi:hypothetical protein
MPLKDYNREFVRLGLKAIAEHHYPEIVSLERQRDPIDETFFGDGDHPEAQRGRPLDGRLRNQSAPQILRQPEMGRQRGGGRWLNSVNANGKKRPKRPKRPFLSTRMKKPSSSKRTSPRASMAYWRTACFKNTKSRSPSFRPKRKTPRFWSARSGAKRASTSSRPSKAPRRPHERRPRFRRGRLDQKRGFRPLQERFPFRRPQAQTDALEEN